VGDVDQYPGVTLYSSEEVELGVGGNPIRVDPTGTTLQPVANTPVVVGTHGNVWNGAVVSVGENSPSIDCQYVAAVSIFGHASSTTTLNVQVSQDNANWYAALAINVSVNGADFYAEFSTGARYIRLGSTLATTITATIAGKSA